MSKNVLVTGGSGAVGGAIVRACVGRGWKVAFTWQQNRESAQQIENETGATAFQADLTDREQVEAMMQEVSNRFGPLDVLINNAGRTQIMPFALIEEEDWDEMMNANLKSMYLVTHEAVRGMIQRKSGAIINIGSLAGQRMLEVPVHYAAAKAAVSGLTRALARELSRYHIRVNEVVPGLLSKGVGQMVPEKEMADYVSHCAAGRPGEPEEVAEAVVFLAGDEARYINAQSLFVDGGI